jgi:hypothetical protein
VCRSKQDVGHISYRIIDNTRGAVENTVPQLIQKLADSDSDVRWAVVHGIVELANDGLLI